MLAVHGLVVSGVPLPMAGGLDAVAEKRLSVKERSTPFPCMDKPCGCATAEQCFTSCCCHTPAETLAWAKANRLEPSLLEALERRLAVAEKPARRAKKSCCGHANDDQEICSDYRSLAANPQWPAEQESRDRNDTDNREDAPRGTSRGRTVSLKAMLACGGVVAAWAAVGIAVLPSPPSFQCGSVPTGTAVLFDANASGVRSAPDAPPPRAC